MPQVQGLLFDVFGTVLDWRSSIEDYLAKKAPVNFKISSHLWKQIAEDWRTEYYKFAEHNSSDENVKDEFITLDKYQKVLIRQLVEKYNISDIWSDEELDDIANVWHHLRPWNDSVQGIKLLKSKYIVASLSNGNVRIMVDVAKHAGLLWDIIFGADIFKTYKPSSKVYLGASEYLDIRPANLVMVAAHIYDLDAAKALGFQTAYIPRPGEDNGLTVTADQVDYFATSLIDLYDQLEADRG
ncbi:HAD-like domain-containing protein [Lipomyces japonicus]|uniref:HAD-like domain-containing protein n=1 Tax=Lipomyces japonicus TaxID=56871 RepID=UPI0034CF0B41